MKKSRFFHKHSNKAISYLIPQLFPNMSAITCESYQIPLTFNVENVRCC